MLPVMVGLAGGGPRAYRPVASRQWTADSLDPAPQAPQAERGLSGPLGAGLLALAVAVSPFVLGWLLFFLSSTMGSSVGAAAEGLLVGIPAMLIAAIVSLAVWAALRARGRGGPMWPPLMITFVLLPVTFLAEFLVGVSMVADENSVYGWVALGIGAGIFALGVWSSWSARRS